MARRKRRTKTRVKGFSYRIPAQIIRVKGYTRKKRRKKK